jgi:hypothetical protein
VYPDLSLTLFSTPMMRSILLASLVALPLAAPAAQTMQVNARPVAGTLTVRADRPRQMADLTLRPVEMTTLEGCSGSVDPSAPDVVVDWRGGDLKLFTRAAADATLLVYGPDQTWHCNDDTEGLSPVVEIADAPRGRYAVWVGTFATPESGIEDLRATLVAGASGLAVRPDPSARPTAGRLDARGGFEAGGGALELPVQAGGLDAVEPMQLDSDEFACRGFINAAAPSATLAYTAGGPNTLAISAAAETDLVLVVQRPDGAWACNDDFGGINPMVGIEDAPSGRYAIWVATYGAQARGAGVAASLTVAETIPQQQGFDGEDFEDFVEEGDFGSTRTPFSTGVYDPIDLSLAPRLRLALDGDDAVSAQVQVTPSLANPVRGDMCTGVVEPGPTVAMRLGGSGPVAITATSDYDLVLNVRTPSGSWFCSDDADGLNPGVQIDDVERGEYLVWVGTFSETDGMAADIEVAATRGELVVSGPEPGPGFDTEFAPYELGSYEGSEIRAGSPATTLRFSGSEASASVQAGGSVLNPVEGGACQGFVTADPTAAVEAQAGEELTIMASAEEADLTMVVRTPDGQWYCSDDAEGSNPMVGVTAETAGTVSIWVGTFSLLSERPAATLSVQR